MTRRNTSRAFQSTSVRQPTWLKHATNGTLSSKTPRCQSQNTTTLSRNSVSYSNSATQKPGRNSTKDCYQPSMPNSAPSELQPTTGAGSTRTHTMQKTPIRSKLSMDRTLSSKPCLRQYNTETTKPHPPRTTQQTQQLPPASLAPFHKEATNHQDPEDQYPWRRRTADAGKVYAYTVARQDTSMPTANSAYATSNRETLWQPPLKIHTSSRDRELLLRTHAWTTLSWDTQSTQITHSQNRTSPHLSKTRTQYHRNHIGSARTRSPFGIQHLSQP